MADAVNHPAHYNSHPSGVEAIEIMRHLDCDLSNVFKYVFRRDGKEPLRSLKSALWYLNDSLQNFPALHAVDRQPFRDAYERVVRAETDADAREFYLAFWQLLRVRTPLTSALVHNALQALITKYETREAA